MEGLFVTIFPWGYCHDGPVNIFQLRHMLQQGSDNFTTEPTFLMFQHNFQQRRNVSRSVIATFKDDNNSIKEINKVLTNDYMILHIHKYTLIYSYKYHYNFF
jgi:hypothetical protein